MTSASARQPIPGFEKDEPDNRERRLGLDIATGAARRNTPGRAAAAGPGSMPGPPPERIAAVRQLRRVDDILIRMLAVKQASVAPHVPMAEVMALYRTEGNLDVPCGFHSVIGLVPSDSHD